MQFLATMEKLVLRYYNFFLEGVRNTLIIAFFAVLLGTLLGTLMAMARMSRIKPLKWIATAYIEFFRGTPLMVPLSLNSCAYVAEIIRSGIQAVDKGQMEAARSLGFHHGEAMKLVILPQAVKNILPALGNEFVTIIKESSIVSVIGIADLMYRAKGVIAKTYNSLECLAIAAIMYFILTFIGGRLIALMERKMAHGRK